MLTLFHTPEHFKTTYLLDSVSSSEQFVAAAEDAKDEDTCKSKTRYLMERTKNSQKLQYDSAETRNEAIPTDARHALNYSIQTGEEFALEFMRDKAISRRPHIPSTSGNQTNGSNFVDLRQRRSISNAGVASEAYTPSYAAENKLPPKIEKKAHAVVTNTEILTLTRTLSHASPGDRSYRAYYSRLTSSEPSPRVKFLCSYGGRFLPRPSDGKLRYVGGNTHILRVSKAMSWKELLQRTNRLYRLTHVIKYQLPGEDIDALVSVFSDEDLQHMVDECAGVEENNEASQNPRMFLFSSDDNVNIHFTIGTMEGDSETQYVAAVNGLEVSGEVSRSPTMQSASAGELDQSLISSVELDGGKRSLAASIGCGGYAYAFESSQNLPLPIKANLTNNSDLHLNYELERMHNPYSPIHQHRNFSSDENGITIPLSMPCDYDHLTRSAPALETCAKPVYKQLIPKWNGTEEFCCGISSNEQNIAKENQSGNRFASPVQRRDISLSNLQLETHYGASPPDFVSPSKPPMNRLETQVLSPFDIISIGKSGKELSQPCTSSEAVNTDCLDYKLKVTGLSSVDPHSTRHLRFKDQMSPNQKKTPFHLSISEDQIGCQRPALDQRSCKKQELGDILVSSLEEIQAFEFDNLSVAGKPVKSNVTNVRNGTKEIQRHKAPSPVIEMNQFELVSGTKTPENSSYGDESMIGNKILTSNTTFSHEKKAALLPNLASNQADGKSNEFQRNVDRFNRSCSASSVDDEKHILNQDRIWNEFDRSRSRESSSSDGRKSTPKVCSEEQLGDESEATKPLSPSSKPSMQKQKKTPTLFQVNRNVGVLSEKSNSLPDIGNNEPHNSFPKAREHKDSLNLNTSRNRGINIGLKMTSNEYQSSLINLFDDEVTSLDAAVDSQVHVHNAPLPTEVEIFATEDRGVQENLLDDPSEIESSLANVGENIRTVILDYEESASDNIEVNEPEVDASVEVPDIRTLQIINNEDLEELRELGSGTFGSVYHGKWRGTDVAIKRIKSSYFAGHSSQTDRMKLGFWREVCILSKLHHPNVVAFYGIVNDEPGGTLATVTEYMAHGSLKHVLQRKEKPLDYRKRLLIAMDAAIGMEYLHSRNVIHFDLKCDNLLVNLKDQSRPICKVCDFGLSKMKLNTMVSGGVRGTLPWMAPELLYTSSNKVSEKIDVYSFGVVMWEILTAEEPYADMHYGEVIGGLLHNTLRPPVPASCDKDWRSLMEQCWAADPGERPTFTQLASQFNSMYKASQTRASS